VIQRLLIFAVLCGAASAQQHSVGVANYVVPKYPPIARQALVQGDVRLQLRLNNNGEVVSVEPVSGHKMLQDVATDAARQWRFVCLDCTTTSPLREHTLTFRFTLDAHCLNCYEFSFPDRVVIRSERPQCWAYVTQVKVTQRPWYLRWIGRRKVESVDGDVPC
jgi:TonB family protein